MKAKAARERGRSVRRRISLDVKDCVEMVVEERREAVRWLLWWLGMVVVRERGCPWSDKQGRVGKVVYFNCLLAVKSSGKL